MIRQRYRFHSRGGVKYTYKQGKTIRSPYLTLVCAKNSRHRQRFAVVVSKKIEKTAVGRNRIRRRVYEAVRQDFGKLKKPRDYIFVVYNKNIKEMSFSELQKLLRSLIEESMLQ